MTDYPFSLVEFQAEVLLLGGGDFSGGGRSCFGCHFPRTVLLDGIGVSFHGFLEDTGTKSLDLSFVLGTKLMVNVLLRIDLMEVDLTLEVPVRALDRGPVKDSRHPVVVLEESLVTPDTER